MTIFKYNPIVIPGPNGTTTTLDTRGTVGVVQLGQKEGVHYAYVPADQVLSDQPPEINLTEVDLTDDLRELIKQHSPLVKRISDQMQQRIRSRYTLEDEQYFARIGVGVALGAYQFQPGEQEAMLEFGNYVESVRDWGRQERAKIGL